jgi:plastocyanin
MQVSTLRWVGLGLFVSVGLGLTAVALRAEDGEGNNRLSVTAAFGSGLNTLPPPPALSGPPNHHILPAEIKVSQGGVVHFLNSGFHMVTVYKPGTGPEDIVAPPSGPTFISDPTKPPPANVFYFGISPQGGPLGTPPTTNPFNGSNRQESVSFSEPGTYLVICNVRQHFRDGMFAFVKVVPPDEELTEDHSHH